MNDIWLNMSEMRHFAALTWDKFIKDMLAQIEKERQIDEIRTDLFYTLNTTYGLLCYNS